MQGILLAAGYGRRFDPSGQTSKLLARLPDGRSIAWHAARTLCDALPGSLAVIRPDQSELSAELIGAGCRILESSDAQCGMGSALAHAVRATATADGWLVALADMPWVPGAAIRSVAGSIDAPTRIAAAAFRGQRGHPVAFGAAHGSALAALCGDSGAREMLRSVDVRLIDAGTADVLRDVDLATDLSPAR